MMNKASISRKVTMALGDLVREGKHDFHIGDAEEVIDDVLSCSKLEFLGNSTRSYFNKNNTDDVRNNKMYTIPVRMDFRDKETRITSESYLRKICKVNCSTPYPKKLRAMLNELISEGKKAFPNTFIKTRVNIDNLTIDAQARTENGWVDLQMRRAIPLNILDNNPLSPCNSQNMEEDESEAASLS
jgi:hypothetical protein